MERYSTDIRLLVETTPPARDCRGCNKHQQTPTCSRIVPNKLFDKESVLRLICCSHSQLKRMIRNGEFPKPMVKVGKALRWQAPQLEQWLQQQLASRNQSAT